MNKEFDLSLAIPCYNEGEHLRESIDTLMDVMENTHYNYEVLFVDDCSTDDTREILKDAAEKYPQCRYLFHSENQGRGAAFKTAFRNTSGRITGFIDIDLEVQAHYIPPLVTLIDKEGYDVVTGHRHYLLSQTGAFLRHILSFCYTQLCEFLLGLGIQDSETGCKFFKRETASGVVLESESNGWFWDTEVMSRASMEGLKIHEMPVLFLRRLDKTSTVQLIPDIIEYLKALWSYRKKLGLSMADRSPIYWTAVGYDLTMRLLLGTQYRETYENVAKLIPEQSSVLDVCGGSAFLYEEFLRNKDYDYTMIDGNGHFVASARKRGINAFLRNLIHDDIPQADYVLVVSSFYHFREIEREVCEKLKAAARKTLVISEPVQNLSTGLPGPLGKLANWLTNPGRLGRADSNANYEFRYTEESFREFAKKMGASEVRMEEGSSNMIAIFETSATKTEPKTITRVKKLPAEEYSQGVH